MITHTSTTEQNKNITSNTMGKETPKGRLILAIATTGRREVLNSTLSRIHRQNRLPDLLVLSIADEADLDRAALAKMPCEVTVKIGPKGACNQRNRVVEALQQNDILLFTDDDFLMSDDYLSNVEHLFQTHTNVVMATGTVLADGIKTAGYSHQEGVELLNSHESNSNTHAVTSVYNGYGCNMAMRATPIVEHGLRFDETLPFYSWLEDVDFSRQLAKYGKVVKSNALTGVHLGTKMGRSSGKLLGYSQISNPIYLSRKGTMRRDRAARIMRRNILSNLARSFRPEPWVDRRGRVYGNILALIDLMRGRLDPGRVLEFTK